MQLFQATIPTQRADAAAPAAGDMEVIERLPFTVKLVQSDDELHKAVRIRHAAYARHVPEFARKLAAPEACDYQDDVIVLLAESKLDGSALGSARLQTNLRRPLPLEQSVALPSWLQGRRLAEVSRLGVDVGRVGHLVKTTLLKACVQYCQQHEIAWAIATGRSPIDRQYEQLTFVDVFEHASFVPLRHVGDIPHRIMAFDISTIDERWSAARHPLLEFFCRTDHPDIDVGQNRGARVAAPGPRPAPSRPVLHPEQLTMA